MCGMQNRLRIGIENYGRKSLRVDLLYRRSNANFVEQTSAIRIVKTELIGASFLDPVRCGNTLASSCKQQLFFSINADVDLAGARISSIPPNDCLTHLFADRHRIWNRAEADHRPAS